MMHRFFTLLFLLPLHLIFSQTSSEWKVKPSSEEISFKIKNMGFWVDGSFSGLKATIHFNPQEPTLGSFQATIDASTVNTGVEARDKHLRQDDFFDVEHYPVISFSSKAITQTSKGYRMDGLLSIKGRTNPISFVFVFAGDKEKGVFHASLEIDRTLYGVGSASRTMGKMVKMELSVPVVK